jgi:quercetin dioxygenase-like cupin family protein
LPNDLCPCPHWGYVLEGRMVVTYTDGEETVRAGDLFYLPPGHAVVAEQDVRYVEFSPPTPYDEFLEVARRNLASGRAP